MSEHSYYVNSLSASEVVQKFLAVAEGINPKSVLTSLQLSVDHIAYPLVVGQTQVNLQDLKSKDEFKTQLSKLSQITFLNVSSFSGVIQSGCTITYREEDNGTTLKVAIQENQGIDVVTNILGIVNQHFNLIKKSDYSRSRIPEEQKRTLDFVEYSMSRFSKEAVRVGQILTDKTVELNELTVRKTNELDELYKKKHAELEERSNKKQNELTEKEKALQQREKDIDLRDNTVVRREIFKRLEEIIKRHKEIKLSEPTVKKRWPVHATFIAFLILAAGGVGAFGWKLFQSTSPDWRLYSFVWVTMITLITTVTFYIRWNISWFDQHARAEFFNLKFESDMLRAGWLVEMFFEWERKKEYEIPAELIRSCTTDLFRDTMTSSARHPFEDLQELIKSFNKMKLGKGGLELEKLGTDCKSLGKQ